MKKFFTFLFISLGVIFCLFIIVFIVVFSAIGSKFSNLPFVLRDGQVLEITINGNIPEAPVDGIARFLKQDEYCFYELISTIDKAADYSEIKGIYLNFIGSSPGWAQTEELVAVLKNFKSKGKKVWAYFDYLDDCGYTLASVADQVYCSENALLLLDGLSASLAFYKETLKKIGLEFETVRHGKYKSAVEPFTLSTISEESREMISVYLKSISKNYTEIIQSNRKVKDINEIISKGPYLITRELKEKGLIDYFNIEEDIFTNENFFEKDLITVLDLLSVPDPIAANSKDKIALIIAEGSIISGAARKGFITDKGLTEDLKDAFYDENIKAVVLRINSPGGSGSASDNIWQFVESQKGEKPFIISMGDFAASGGYYIAMNGQQIFADKNTTTGSIGVFFMRPLLEGVYNKIGMNVVTIKTAPNAGFFTSEKPLNELQRNKVQDFIDNFYSGFVDKAARGRGKKYSEIDALAQGRIWSGSQAKENGLIDSIGGLLDAIDAAKIAAGLEDENVEIKIFPESRPFIEQLMDKDLYIKGNLSKWIQYADTYSDIMDEKGEIKLIMPFNIDVN